MKYYSFVLTLTILLISLSLISVSAQAVDVNISGPDSTYNCKDYNYTLTVYNPSLDERAIDINTRFHLPIGYTTTDSNYSITALNPGEFDQRIIHVRTRCNAAVGSLTVNGDYNSSFTFNKSYPITIYPGAVTIEKLPSTQNATLENNVSWTITVTSSGLGFIENVIINDTLQPGLLVFIFVSRRC